MSLLSSARFSPLLSSLGLHRQALEVIGRGRREQLDRPGVDRKFRLPARIIDRFDASEHHRDCAKAVHHPQTPMAVTIAEELEAWLWDGKIECVITRLSDHSVRLGEPQSTDTP